MLRKLIAGPLLVCCAGAQTLEQAKRAFDQGDYATATRLFEQANRTSPSCEFQFYIGMSRYRQGQPGPAIIAFQTAVQCDPKLILAHLALAEAYAERGNDSAALAALQKALAIEPKNTAALRGAAAIYLRSKSPEKAVELLKTVVEVEPRDPQAHAELGAAYFATGNYEGALPQFEEALRLKQDSPDALLGLANIHLKKGEENQAIALLQKVVRTAPKEAAPHFLLGTAYNRLGRYQDALAELQSAVRLGADGPDAYYHLARAYGGLGNAEERRAALAKFAELTRKGKEDTEGQRRAGRLVDEAGTMVEAGNLQAAVAALETARELRPSDDRILFRLAGLYYDLRRDAGARSYVEEAISLAPSQWLYHYLLGLIESRSGEKRLARASLETALKLNPNASEVSKALQDLQ